MANGTCSRRARVWARAVLPQPVGPIRRTLLLETSTSWSSGSVDLAAEHPLVVVDDRDGQRLLHPLLADDVVVQVGHQLAGRRQLLELGVLPLVLVEEALTDLDAMGADVRDRPARGHGHERPPLDHRTGLGAVPAAEITKHGGRRRGRALFGRQGCHSGSKMRIGNPYRAISIGLSTSAGSGGIGGAGTVLTRPHSGSENSGSENLPARDGSERSPPRWPRGASCAPAGLFSCPLRSLSTIGRHPTSPRPRRRPRLRRPPCPFLGLQPPDPTEKGVSHESSPVAPRFGRGRGRVRVSHPRSRQRPGRAQAGPGPMIGSGSGSSAWEAGRGGS